MRKRCPLNEYVDCHDVEIDKMGKNYWNCQFDASAIETDEEKLNIDTSDFTKVDFFSP